LITQWVPQAQLRQFSVRFQGITHLGDQITCRGRVVDKWEKNGERKIVLEISTGNQFGHPKVTGMAIVDLH
jgi:peptidyl-tRNA hydrolase